MKYTKVMIDGEMIDCRIVLVYADGSVRVEYPTYCNGRFNGYEATTVTRDKIISEGIL